MIKRAEKKEIELCEIKLTLTRSICTMIDFLVKCGYYTSPSELVEEAIVAHITTLVNQNLNEILKNIIISKKFDEFIDILINILKMS